MQLTETHYKLRIESGKWKTPTKKDIKITALKVQINQIQTKSSSTPVANAVTTKNKYNPNDPKHAWKKIPPTSNETTKEVEKKICNWCLKS
jgi:hypothetical protein